jgi:RNA ligase (TIGR02306 family)
MRKLASVQKITEVIPHPTGDALDICTVLGYKVVTQKTSGFKSGDLAVFVEPDSKPPPIGHPSAHLFQFLRDKHSGTEESLRLKTIKLRGQVSQGLLLSMDEVKQKNDVSNWYEGLNVTESLGVTKWEPPLPMGGDQIGPFNSRIGKTDEDRAQSNPELIEVLWERPYVITEKVDGTSITMVRDDEGFHVYSRSWEMAEGENMYWRGARSNDFEGWLAAHGNQYALQGELYGPGIQKNRLEAKELGIKIFNIIDLGNGQRLNYYSMHYITDGANGTPVLDLVRAVEFGSQFQYHLEELLLMAEDKYPGTSSEREGLVIRNNDYGGPVSFKVISQRYLLKGGE